MNSSGVWHAQHAWLGQVAENVLIDVHDGRITKVTEGMPRPAAAIDLRGFTVPGFANAHSHAFQIALRGKTQEVDGDFWEWRKKMYELAAILTPDSMHKLALEAYREMANAGITAVGEFHYVHHRPDGGRYDDPNAMGAALIAAASEVGIRITLIDACYLYGGLGKKPLEGAQVRFGDGDAASWANRVEVLKDSPGVRIGAAIHSVRAVDPLAMRAISAFARIKNRPLHLHLAEQPAEVEECMHAFEVTPTMLCSREEVLGAGTTAVHAIELNKDDVVLLGRYGTHVCVCPTTERDLGDHVGPTKALADHGAALCLGSDSNAVIDLFEEARGVELDQRRAIGKRGLHKPAELLGAATRGGMQSLGWDAGELAAGRLADFVTVRLEDPDPSRLIFASSARDVINVVVGGRTIVKV